MRMLSDDDLDLVGMSDGELERAWDLWFGLVQGTNDDDPPYTHGVFAHLTREELGLVAGSSEENPAQPRGPSPSTGR